MGLLDNLFKPKPESGGEKSVESAPGEDGEEHGAAAQNTGASSQKTSPFLAPKIYVPRSSVQIVPPVRTQPQGDRQLAPVVESGQTPREIVLTLGDVLSRIPTHFLREGKPDLRRELRFPSEGLAADIARGRAAVYLADVVAQCPDLFLPEVNGFDDIQIRLPLQKLVEQIAHGAGNQPPVSNPTPTPAPEPVPAPPAAIQPPASPTPVEVGEVQIHLSLAAIMRRCPREIIVQPLPPIEESVRVTFPFAPIERQLSTGQVEVSSLRFIAALPLGLMKFFEARAGVKVPLPLEEIFQNLPNRTPLPAVQTRLSAVTPPEEVPAEATDRMRENAKLAEAILLEPMFEPVANGGPHPSAPGTPPPVENVVINATFAPDPPVAPATEIHELVSSATSSPKEEAPLVEELPAVPAPIAAMFSPVISEPEKTDAALELEAQLEALAAEDAKSDSRLAEDSLLEPLPTPPLEKTPMPFPESAQEPAKEVPANAPAILPELPHSPAETVTNLPAPLAEPVTPPVGLPAFRQFAPPLRPPVILQPKSGPGELRPTPEAMSPAAPEAVPAPIPTPAPEPTQPLEPSLESVAPTPEVVSASPTSSVASVLPPPLTESVFPSPAAAQPSAVAPKPEAVSENAPPIAVEPPPVAMQPPPTVTDPVGQTLRIGPPQFRPFVVHAPPIVLTPKEALEAMPSAGPDAPDEPPAESLTPVPPPLAMQPPIAEPQSEFPKEIIAEELPAIPEPEPERVVEPPADKYAAPLPDFPAFESASPFLLDGKVREFFQSDAPIPFPRVSQLLAALPGIHGCVLITRAAESQSGELPVGLDSSAIRDLSQRMRGALSDRAGAFGADELQHLTLHAEQYSVSLFTRGEACACAIHRARIFLPGVRERFAAVAEELARARH